MLRTLRTPLHALALSVSCTASSDDPATTGSSSSSSSASTGDDEPTTLTPTGDGTTDADATTSTSTTTSTTASDDTTTLAATTTNDDTTGAPLRCGDGVVDPGEQCDLGHGVNSNSASSCTLDCKNAVCGDNLVWEGHEACDEGKNLGNYGGCLPDCSLAPHCGDGEINGPEQCDLGLHNGSGEHYLDAVPCSHNCYHEALLVFLSSTPFAPSQLGGAGGADKRCQELAEAAGLYGGAPFRAWISDKYSDPASRFAPAVPGMPYALLNGLRVADDRAALLKEGPEIGIAMTEEGVTLYQKRVWTATKPDGVKLPGDLDCEDWTKDSALWKGSVGHSGVDKADANAWQTWKTGQYWTTFKTGIDCHFQHHLYCFEQ